MRPPSRSRPRPSPPHHSPLLKEKAKERRNRRSKQRRNGPHPLQLRRLFQREMDKVRLVASLGERMVTAAFLPLRSRGGSPVKRASTSRCFAARGRMGASSSTTSTKPSAQASKEHPQRRQHPLKMGC